MTDNEYPVSGSPERAAYNRAERSAYEDIQPFDTAPQTRAELREQNNETPNRWIPSRAARLWLYGVAVAAAAVLVAYGVITVEQGGVWLVLVGALLGVAPAVAARNVPRG